MTEQLTLSTSFKIINLQQANFELSTSTKDCGGYRDGREKTAKLEPFSGEMMKVKSESEVAQSCLSLCDPWTAAHQVPPSMGFSRQEHWSGLLFPSPGDPPKMGIEPRSPTMQADSLPSEPPGKLPVIA